MIVFQKVVLLHVNLFIIEIVAALFLITIFIVQFLTNGSSKIISSYFLVQFSNSPINPSR